ncbi:MAG: methyltransferase, TIGR04325 family, partial [Planctomycetes bacterium]|nr:methyltransferase, TIGR04325 family [Planctomycetota bacterium]
SKSPKTIPDSPAYGTSLLPFLASLIYEKQGSVRILDFGGNLGFAYVPVINGMEDSGNLDYHVVEVQQICDMGTRIFADDHRVHFHTGLSSEIPGVDVIHVGSTLQYMEDWTALIGQLAGYHPQYFLFTDLQAGDIPTYATAQNYYGSMIPCWFFNVHEIVDTMSNLGLSLIFKATHDVTILGKQRGLPQDNFPEEYRVGHPCSLLFCRQDH